MAKRGKGWDGGLWKGEHRANWMRERAGYVGDGNEERTKAKG